MNSYNKSYRVDIDPIDRVKSLDSDLWYKGLVVKPFRQQRHKTTPSSHYQPHPNHINNNSLNQAYQDRETQHDHRNHYINETNHYNGRFDW